MLALLQGLTIKPILSLLHIPLQAPHPSLEGKKTFVAIIELAVRHSTSAALAIYGERKTAHHTTPHHTTCVHMHAHVSHFSPFVVHILVLFLYCLCPPPGPPIHTHTHASPLCLLFCPRFACVNSSQGISKDNALWVLGEKADERLLNFFQDRNILEPKAVFDYIEEDIHCTARTVRQRKEWGKGVGEKGR